MSLTQPRAAQPRSFPGALSKRRAESPQELHHHSTAQQFMSDVKKRHQTLGPSSQYFSQEERKKKYNKNFIKTLTNT